VVEKAGAARGDAGGQAGGAAGAGSVVFVMNRRTLLAGVAGVVAGAGPGWAQAAGCPAPPATPRVPDRIVQLGRARVDDYAWLKPANWRAVWRDPAVLPPDIAAHLRAETAYAEAMLAPDAALRRDLLADMTRRSPDAVDEPPQVDGAYAYFSRTAPGAQHPVFLRRAAGGGAAATLLDVEALARARGGYVAVTATAHSPDHRLFAWAQDDVGSENFTLYVKDTVTGAVLPGPAQQAYGDFVFSADSQWLYWTWRSPDSRPSRIYRRPARGGADVLVYEERDPAFLMQLSRTASRAYVLIRVWNADTSEVRFIPSFDPTAAPRVIEPRTPGMLYSVEHWDGRFVVLTNADGAVDFKLMWAEAGAPGRAGWRPWVPYRPGRFITGIRAFEGHLVRTERADANLRVIIADRGSLAERAVPFDAPAYAVALDAGDAYAASTLRLIYQSPRTPRRWLDVDMASGRARVAAAERPAAFDPARYRVERLFARSPDGATVPMTVLSRADAPRDGRAPLLLYGYGAYGFCVEAEFSPAALALVDRGWTWGIAHVRGGSEKGWGWYLAARKADKPRSFADFIACAEHLADQGYTRRGRVVAHGLSAGGLLVGASLNLRPDLFAGVIGQAPFVDVLNTMSDAQHPLVPLARPDWGDPLVDPAAYDAIAGYSPYDNVRPARYPAVLAATSVADDRVGFWEPAKWIARLRATTTGRAPMLLQVDAEGGHHGRAGRLEALAQTAGLYAFAIRAVEGGWPCA
jgi:oligopeptidase B